MCCNGVRTLIVLVSTALFPELGFDLGLGLGLGFIAQLIRVFVVHTYIHTYIVGPPKKTRKVPVVG
jgi:hypothetical protein